MGVWKTMLTLGRTTCSGMGKLNPALFLLICNKGMYDNENIT